MAEEFLPQQFGYSEMYEWEVTPQPQYRLGRFVTFSKNIPGKIVPTQNADQHVIGVTTVNTVTDSDDPNEWKYKNTCNEYGDIFLQKEKLAVGQKVYDQNSEMNYIQTRPWEHFITIPNQKYDGSRQYVKRSNRPEWVRVNLMGKCIVEDNGLCKPGDYCMPYTGKIKTLQGTAVPVPAGTESKNMFYVIGRFSEKTIIILNK